MLVLARLHVDSVIADSLLRPVARKIWLRLLSLSADLPKYAQSFFSSLSV